MNRRRFIQKSTAVIETVHVKTATLLKPIKCIFGRGRMIQIYEGILAATEMNDRVSVRAIWYKLLACEPPFWSPHYTKHMQLTLFCKYCLATDEKIKAVLYSELLWLLTDDAHELTRRMRAYLEDYDYRSPA
jgi:hypothetical protein